MQFDSSTLSLAIDRMNWLFFWYYAGSTLSYIVLIFFAYLFIRRHHKKVHTTALEIPGSSLPSVTIIAPAKNEQACILRAARSFLAMDYPNLEVLFVDDGSTDSTFELLLRAYQLQATSLPHEPALPHTPIESVWRSATDPRLTVVRKQSAGFKGDATNAGLEIASGEYTLVTDTDSVLEKETVLRMVSVVLQDPRTIAVGGNLHAVNGCEVAHGELSAVRSPKHYYEIVQVVEYIRAFFMSRLGWSYLNMTPIISGALGLYRTDVLRAVGGFANVLAEDLDMTLKVHRHIRDHSLSNRIGFAPDAKAWTEVPPSYWHVSSQRIRWHNSLCDVLWRFRSMLFRPTYGRIGFILLPWLWAYELMAPLVEVVAWTTIVLAAVIGCLNWRLAPLTLGGGYALTVVLSVISILQSEGRYPRYSRPDKRKLLVQTVFELFPFRFLHNYWRLRGQISYFLGDRRWKPIPRGGFDMVEQHNRGD